MALKVGMRIRVRPLPDIYPPCWGREGVVTATDSTRNRGEPIEVMLDGLHSSAFDGSWTGKSGDFEPLVDPDSEWADAQIAKLKKLGPHPVREVA